MLFFSCIPDLYFSLLVPQNSWVGSWDGKAQLAGYRTGISAWAILDSDPILMLSVTLEPLRDLNNWFKLLKLEGGWFESSKLSTESGPPIQIRVGSSHLHWLQTGPCTLCPCAGAGSLQATLLQAPDWLFQERTAVSEKGPPPPTYPRSVGQSMSLTLLPHSSSGSWSPCAAFLTRLLSQVPLGDQRPRNTAPSSSKFLKCNTTDLFLLIPQPGRCFLQLLPLWHLRALFSPFRLPS